MRVTLGPKTGVMYAALETCCPSAKHTVTSRHSTVAWN